MPRAPGGRRGGAHLAVPGRERQQHGSIPHFIRLDFAYASRTVFYVMAGIMAVAAVVALVGLERGVQAEPESEAPAPADEGARPAAGPG